MEEKGKKTEDSEYQTAFDKSFYGKASVKAVQDDQYKLRIKMLESCGSNTKNGLTQNMNAFWKSTSKPFSKPFLKENPDFLNWLIF